MRASPDLALAPSLNAQLARPTFRAHPGHLLGLWGLYFAALAWAVRTDARWHSQRANRDVRLRRELREAAREERAQRREDQAHLERMFGVGS